MAHVSEKHIDLSIIIPAYNEAAIIRHTLDALAEYLGVHPDLGTVEVIVVAAGTDETADIARSYTDRFHELQVLAPKERVGKGRDVRIGFQAAHGTYQLFTDADLSTPLRHIHEAVRLLEAGNDIVIGTRNLLHIHVGKARTLVSVASNRFIRLLLLPGIKDSQCGFKAFRAEAAHYLFHNAQHINGWAFDVEILAAARQRNYQIAQLAIGDWHETRDDDLRNDNLVRAVGHTFQDVLRLRLRLWVTSLERRNGLFVLLAGLLSLGLSLQIGMQQSVWFDEAYSISLAQHSLSQIVRLTAVDVHPPLYYFLLKGWMALFGNSDLALRSMSALCSATAVTIGLLLVRRLWDARIMLLVLPFAVLAPFVLRYGFEIRMYALASLLGITATYVLVRAREANGFARTRLWTLYALLLMAGLYTLYYTALIWLAHFVWYFYGVIAKHPKVSWTTIRKQQWPFPFLVAALAFVPWLPVFHYQLHHVQHNFWIPPATYRRVVSLVSFFFNYKAEWQLASRMSLVFLLSVISALYFIITAFRTSDERHRRSLLLLMLITLVPPTVLYLASLPPLQPVFHERYMSEAILATYLLVGVAVATVLRYRFSVWRLLAAVGLLAVMIHGVVTLAHTGNFNFDELDKPSTRQISAYIGTWGSPANPIVADVPTYLQVVHYLPHHTVLFYSPHDPVTYGGYAILHDSPHQVTTLNAFQGQTVWLVYITAAPPYVPRNHVAGPGIRIGRYRAYRYNPSSLPVSPASTQPLQLH